MTTTPKINGTESHTARVHAELTNATGYTEAEAKITAYREAVGA